MRIFISTLIAYVVMATAYKEWWPFPTWSDPLWKEKTLVWVILYTCVYLYNTVD